MTVNCAECGALTFQEHLGRPRRYCSEACRRLADSRRRAERTPAKPAACLLCSTPIVQKTTGRPRQYCAVCASAVSLPKNADAVPQKTARNVLAAL